MQMLKLQSLYWVETTKMNKYKGAKWLQKKYAHIDEKI